jgi:GcrA cell cycle regulator
MDWSPERIAELTKLWNDGLATSEIGKRLGISKNAVVGKAHRLHLSARPSPIRRVMMRSVLPRPPRPLAEPRVLAPTGLHSGVHGEARTPAPTPAPQPERIVELSNQSCKWPIGHPNEAGFHFCAERAIVGKPYCQAHTAIAYVRTKPKAGEAA